MLKGVFGTLTHFPRVMVFNGVGSRLGVFGLKSCWSDKLQIGISHVSAWESLQAGLSTQVNQRTDLR